MEPGLFNRDMIDEKTRDDVTSIFNRITGFDENCVDIIEEFPMRKTTAD